MVLEKESGPLFPMKVFPNKAVQSEIYRQRPTLARVEMIRRGRHYNIRRVSRWED
jgi:hypothetical protein